MPALDPSDAAIAGRKWNRRTLDLIRRHITQSEPLARGTRGGHVSLDTASGYVGALRLLRSREADYDIAPADESDFVSALEGKTVRRREPPQSERKVGTAVRAAHLKRASLAGIERESEQGAVSWCVAVLSHNLLLRGGEPGESDNAPLEAHRILRGRSFDWQGWRRPLGSAKIVIWLIVWIVPIKVGTTRAHPIPVVRRHSGPFGADPLCPYDATALVWWRKACGGWRVPFPVDEHGWPAEGWWHTPRCPAFLNEHMFASAGGALWTTRDTRAIAQRIATAAGISTVGVGGKAFRIGGATDARERLGEKGLDRIRRRGRWCSLITLIYQRELVDAQLELSAELGDAVGESLEEVCVGWVQPTGM